MTAPQTSLSRFPATEAQAGDVAHPFKLVEVESKSCGESVGLYAGFFVCVGDATDKCEAPDSSGDVTSGSGLGIALRDKSKFTESDDPDFAETETVPVLTLGTVWVNTEDAATFGSQPCVRFTTDTDGSDLGAFRSDTDGGKAVALPGARFRTTRADAGLALVEYSRVHGPVGATGPTGPTGP